MSRFKAAARMRRFHNPCRRCAALGERCALFQRKRHSAIRIPGRCYLRFKRAALFGDDDDLGIGARSLYGSPCRAVVDSVDIEPASILIPDDPLDSERAGEKLPDKGCEAFRCYAFPGREDIMDRPSVEGFGMPQNERPLGRAARRRIKELIRLRVTCFNDFG